MKKNFSIILISLVCAPVIFAQGNFKKGDTIFYHKGIITENKLEADFYNIIFRITQLQDSKIRYRMQGFKKEKGDSIFYLNTEYQTLLPEGLRAEGFQRFYHKNGKKSSEGKVKKGKPIGLWRYWYDNEQIREERIIPENKALTKKWKNYTLQNFWKRDGEQTLSNGNGYFELKNDSLISTGSYKNQLRHGKFTGTINTRKYYEEIYKNGKIVSGVSWDTKGNKFKYKEPHKNPRYKNGQKSIAKHIRNHFKIPPYAYENNLDGRVVISFIVTKSGNLDKIKIIKSLAKPIDDEAIRVIKLFKKWKPGEVRGQKANVRYTLPLSYKL